MEGASSLWGNNCIKSRINLDIKNLWGPGTDWITKQPTLSFWLANQKKKKAQHIF